MTMALLAPTITVTIGRQTRVYHAFITTAPAAYDAPSTLTLHAASLNDVAGLAADVRNDALTNGGAVYGITNVTAPCTGFAGSAAFGGTACNVSAFSDALSVCSATVCTIS